MRTTWTALKLFICLSALTGLLYPLAVWGGARLFLRARAEGSMVEAGGRAAGSALVGQNFSGARYFHPRPSAVNYGALPSGGSNLSPASAALEAAVKQRRALYGAAAPADMLTASGSGLESEPNSNSRPRNRSGTTVTSLMPVSAQKSRHNLSFSALISFG